ncbi:MAG: hypothetical protein ACF8AM_21895 [Rhodopirellula sp. JB055]|uniref:hypothetical protein n=1 Tax=Rhodopirellula sp. JB055 TaxID=3342846 RepID=UPI00370C4E3F
MADRNSFPHDRSSDSDGKQNRINHGYEFDNWQLQNGDSVEHLIRNAGRYVRPSSELRPRVLESVRHQSQTRKQTGGALGMLGLGMATMLSFVWGGQSMQSIAPLPRVTSDEVEQEAMLRSSMTNQSLDWGLRDVMDQQRPSKQHRANAELTPDSGRQR